MAWGDLYTPHMSRGDVIGWREGCALGGPGFESL